MAGLTEVAVKAGFEKGQVSDVQDVFTALHDLVMSGEKVIVKGFGTFTRDDTPARTARNPSNGEPVAVPPKQKMKFKPAPGTIVVVEEAKKTSKKKTKKKKK